MLDTCSGCGLAVEEGTRGCRAMFDALTIRQWNAPVPYPLRRMMVDTYALQHPDEFCVSAKSFAAHLTGLCAALEHPSHPGLLKVLLEWLDARPALEKPALPSFRGRQTVAGPLEAPDAGRLREAAHTWARSTWDAYQPLHPLARRWVAAALAGRPARG